MTGEGLSIERGALEQLAFLLLERAGLKITPDGYYGLRLALQARMPAHSVHPSMLIEMEDLEDAIEALPSRMQAKGSDDA